MKYEGSQVAMELSGLSFARLLEETFNTISMSESTHVI